ncbi:MAG: ATP-binding protein [candidate division NC10 bacterium]|nr:ATP-binding protein [candidate division NC10 bacterium]
MERHTYPFTAIVGQEQMRKALVFNAIDPTIGGVLIRGEKGTAKSTAVRGLAAVLPPRVVVRGCLFSCAPGQPEGLCPECAASVAQGKSLPLTEGPTPVIDLPLNASEDRVVGTLDIEHALTEGRKRFAPGLLATAHRAILYVDEVNLLDDHLVDVLLDVAVTGINVVEREGVTYSHPARFLLVGTMNPEEGDLRPQLLDRFGLCAEVTAEKGAAERKEIVRRSLAFQRDPAAFGAEWEREQQALRDRIEAAQKALPALTPSEALLETAAHMAIEMKVDGHRAEITLIKTALASAAFHGRSAPDRDDLRDAMAPALRHRTKRMPLQSAKLDATLIERLVGTYPERGHL